MSAAAERAVITCRHCRLVQYETAAQTCRRCRRTLVEVTAPAETVTRPSAPVGGRVQGMELSGEALTQAVALVVWMLRLEKGLSQPRLAARMAVPRTYVSKIEHGHTLPVLQSLERVAAGLEVPLAELVRLCEVLQALLEAGGLLGELLAWRSGRPGGEEAPPEQNQRKRYLRPRARADCGPGSWGLLQKGIEADREKGLVGRPRRVREVQEADQRRMAPGRPRNVTQGAAG